MSSQKTFQKLHGQHVNKVKNKNIIVKLRVLNVCVDPNMEVNGSKQRPVSHTQDNRSPGIINTLSH